MKKILPLGMVFLCVAGGNALARMEVWVEHSAVKLLRTAEPPQQCRREADLCAARREWESFQLALRSDVAVSDVNVIAGELKQIGGKGVIPDGWISLFRVAYVPIKDPPVPYPDPLPPLTPFDLNPNETQPIWVTVKVPAQCPAGEYRGHLSVKAPGMSDIRIPIRLRVWDFSLPVTPYCTTAFGLDVAAIARIHAADGNRLLSLRKKYYEFLLERKISTYSIPVDLKSPEAKSYLEDPRMTSYVIPYLADDAELRGLIDYLIENNWFRKGFFYPLDEPVTKESYDRLVEIAQRLRSIEPRYRQVAPFFRGPDFAEGKTIYDYALGLLNIWCPNELYLDTEKRTRPFLRARKNAGEEIWWYVCCGPGVPYANFFVDMSAISHRMLFWHQKREGIEGLLYWNTTYWNPAEGCEDPWKSMMTVKSISPSIFGDGSLLYPGTTVGIDGPVSSLRLEVIRDGIEDFDYLCMAEEMLGEQAVAGFVKRLAKTLTDYETDCWKLEAVRRDLGQAIESAYRERCSPATAQ